MNSQVNFVERRDHPRVGVMAQLENITYSVLRKHGVVSGPGSEAPTPMPITHWVEQQGDPTMASLTVIWSNDQPKRQETTPRTWLLYNNRDIIEIDVRHGDSRIDTPILNRAAWSFTCAKRADAASDTKSNHNDAAGRNHSARSHQTFLA